MSFWQKLREWPLGLISFGGNEYPGAGRDVVLAVLMGLAALVLIVYPTEHQPSERLRHAAVASAAVIVVGLILARRKLVVIGGVAAIVGFRAAIAALLGLWQGALIAVVACAVVVLCIRNSEVD